MPSTTFLLSPPSSSSEAETLPAYDSGDDLRPTSSLLPAFRAAPPQRKKRCCTILDVVHDPLLEEDERLHYAGYGDSKSKRPRDLKTRIADRRSMVLQALLVDASTTLCMYLFFTTIQSRLLHQSSEAGILLKLLCASPDHTAKLANTELCFQAQAHIDRSPANLVFSPENAALVQYATVAFVLLKGLVGYSLMDKAQWWHRYVGLGPFDWLVASGAGHALVLYFTMFMSIRSIIKGPFLRSIWSWLTAQRGSNVFWSLVLTSCIFGFHRLVRTVTSREARRKRRRSEAEAASHVVHL